MTKTIIWNGATRTDCIEDIEARHDLADAAKNYDWNRLLALLEKHPELINATRSDGPSFYAPLHQAAHGGAPIEVMRRLVELGAWRTLQNAQGEILIPDLRRHVPTGILLKIQSHFHVVIRGRAGSRAIRPAAP